MPDLPRRVLSAPGFAQLLGVPIIESEAIPRGSAVLANARTGEVEAIYMHPADVEQIRPAAPRRPLRRPRKELDLWVVIPGALVAGALLALLMITLTGSWA